MKLQRNERGFLFDPGPKPRRPRWRGGKALIPLLAACGRCRFPTAVRSATQAPLFFHGGYGEARQTSTRFCALCGWTGPTVTASVNPRPSRLAVP